MRVRLAVLWLLAGGAGACDPGGDIGQPQTRRLPSCPAVRCSGGVSFAADLAATAAEAPDLEVRLCRNELCSTLRPTADGAGFGCDFAGPLTAACRLTPSGGGLHLEITFQGVMTSWAAGDLFAVRVGRPGATPLIDVRKAVDGYVETRPAGEDCPPVCRSATLT